MQVGSVSSNVVAADHMKAAAQNQAAAQTRRANDGDGGDDEATETAAQRAQESGIGQALNALV